MKLDNRYLEPCLTSEEVSCHDCPLRQGCERPFPDEDDEEVKS